MHPAVDREVDLKVFHRGINVLFDRRWKPVNLINEEDVPFAELGERADQVRRLVQGRSTGDPRRRSHLVRDHVGQRGLPESGRAVQEHMLHGFAACLHGLHRDGEPLDQGRLADIVFEGLGANRRSGRGGRGGGFGSGVFLPTLRFPGDDSLSCHDRIIGAMSDRRQSPTHRSGDLPSI